MRRAHGVGGDVRVAVLTDFPALRFAPGAQVLLGRGVGGDATAAEVVAARPYRDDMLVRFDVAASREAARRLAGMWVLAAADTSPALEEGAFYIHELLGLTASTVDGRLLGRVAEVIETGTADVIVVQGEATHLVPLTTEAIAEIDLEAGRVAVRPIPGLLDEPTA